VTNHSDFFDFHFPTENRFVQPAGRLGFRKVARSETRHNTVFLTAKFELTLKSTNANRIKVDALEVLRPESHISG